MSDEEEVKMTLHTNPLLDSDAEVNERHRQELADCIARHPVGTAFREGSPCNLEMAKLREVHRAEWQERKEARSWIEKSQDSEEWKAKRKELARKGDKVKHKHGWIGTVVRVTRETYVVVRPNGARLELPHSDWTI